MEHNIELNNFNYFESIPGEVQAKIFNYLTLKDLVGRLARSSKHVANIIQNSLSMYGGPHNSLNILVTGHHGAGSSTLYTRLQEELGINSMVRNLSESNEVGSNYKLVDDRRCQISAIKLENTRANLWHGSTKENRVKRMYPHCGAAQCIIYVVSCSEIATRGDSLRNDIRCYHALTSDVQWIFVINKMDQVQYNEQEYNKCVESIKKIAVKVVGEQRLDRLHFIPMCTNDMKIRVTSDNSNQNMTWNSMNLWRVLNQVASESCSSPLKMFRKFKATIIRTYGWIPNVSGKDEGYVIVYILEGCISVGDHIQIIPDLFGPYIDQRYKYASVEVVGIQSYNTNKTIALPNSYVGLAIKKPTALVYHTKIRPTPKPKYSIVHYPGITLSNEKKHRYYYYNQYRWDPLYEAVIVHVGHQTGRYKWHGMIHEGFDAAIHSIGIRGGIKILTIRKIYDKNGNPLDLEVVKKERNMLALKRGEKADVTLYSMVPLNVTIRDSPHSINDVNGRFVIQTQNNHVVAVGAIVKIQNPLFADQSNN